MAENPAGERTEDATPKRRADARKKGTVARSVDLTSALGLLVAALVLPAALSQLGAGLMQGMAFAMRSIPSDGTFSSLGRYTMGVVQPALGPMAMVVAVALTVGVAANFAQVGFVLSAEPMNPTFGKLNPLNGIKRIFSAYGAVEGLKALLKTAVFSWLAYRLVVGEWDTLIGLSSLTAAGAMSAVGDLLRRLIWQVAAVWLALAAIDYLFQRKNTDKQLRMTKQELKQEMKEAESSPEMKGERLRRSKRRNKGKLADALKSAQVVVTNPTHFAVAIAYDPSKDAAPKVVAKGQDYLAQRIREIASEQRVPLVPNPPLARALYKNCEVGDYVPRDLFQPVAEVLAYVHRALRRVRGLD